MMIGSRPCKASYNCLARRLDPPVGQFGQLRRISDARDHRLYHPPSAEPENIADDRVELDVGLFERFLDPLDMAGLLTAQLLAGTQQRAKLLDRLFRNEARLDQAASYQIGDPCRVVDVRLAAGTFLMWAAFATISSNVPSLRMFQTGFQ